jgi:hypothetical protein
LLARSGEPVGRLDDVIVRLRGGDYPLVTGLVGTVGRRRVYLSMKRVAELGEDRIVLAREQVDLRGFERRDGEVLLREDILGHRLIDVADAGLVRAYDVELLAVPAGWVLARLDTRRPARLFGLVKQSAGHAARDWKAFEPLIGHTPSALVHGPFARVSKLKAAQIVHLLEDAHGPEGSDILEQVHADPELEADVFEELDPDPVGVLGARARHRAGRAVALLDASARVARVGEVRPLLAEQLGQAEHVGIEVDADVCRLGRRHAASAAIS